MALAPPPTKAWLSTEDLPFAVVDVETTGFSPRLHDRVVEIAIVTVSADGSIQDEYSTLVNPLRDVGATHIHGITATDLVQAPTFVEVMGDVLERLSGRVLVAHNIRFDRDFLAAEFSMEGVFLPAIPSLCTLELAYRLHPGLANHRLGTCCAAAGLKHDQAHSALADARAVAHLLVAYIRKAQEMGWISLADLGCSPVLFPLGLWPSLPATGRFLLRRHDGSATAFELPFLARMVAALSMPSVGPKLAPYMDLLDRVLEDRIVTQAEADALQATAIEWGLSPGEVLGAHHAYLESLITAALADNFISESERRDLEAVTRLLAMDPAVLHALLDRTDAAALPAPEGVGTTPGDALASSTVCFTGSLRARLPGGQIITRDLATDLARAAGLHVRENVTKDLAILVVADPNTLSGKARQARRYGTRIVAEQAFWHAIGVQVY